MTAASRCWTRAGPEDITSLLILDTCNYRPVKPQSRQACAVGARSRTDIVKLARPCLAGVIGRIAAVELVMRRTTGMPWRSARTTVVPLRSVARVKVGNVELEELSVFGTPRVRSISLALLMKRESGAAA